jgi:hypothetical protein
MSQPAIQMVHMLLSQLTHLVPLLLLLQREAGRHFWECGDRCGDTSARKEEQH